VFAVGDWVIYRPYPGAPAEDGEILRFSDDPSLAFVLYAGDRSAKATRLADLTHGVPGVTP
jgi:hypothetical protein